jgi:hypothetical protein
VPRRRLVHRHDGRRVILRTGGDSPARMGRSPDPDMQQPTIDDHALPDRYLAIAVGLSVGALAGSVCAIVTSDPRWSQWATLLGVGGTFAAFAFVVPVLARRQELAPVGRVHGRRRSIDARVVGLAVLGMAVVVAAGQWSEPREALVLALRAAGIVLLLLGWPSPGSPRQTWRASERAVRQPIDPGE